MTEREYLNKVLAIEGISEEMKTATNERIAKLDTKNEKRKGTETKIQKENKPIADAILAALANGAMLGVDLAVAIGQTTNKTNGIALNLVKEGKITSTKVKVKGKGERTQYELIVTETADEETADEDGATAEEAEVTATE